MPSLTIRLPSPGGLTSRPLGPSIRIWVKKQIRLDRLNFNQQAMAQLGFEAVNLIKRRTLAAIGPNDLPSKPLTKRWARRKAGMGLKPVRDLRGPGWPVKKKNETPRQKKRRMKILKSRTRVHMMDNLSPRTVRDNQVVLGFTTQDARTKARRNAQIENFLWLSPSNLARLRPLARALLRQAAQKMVKVVSVVRRAA